MEDIFNIKIMPAIVRGGAILFTGSGFSKNCKNKFNESLPDAKELAKKICELGKFPSSNNLGYAAQRYIDQNSANKDRLTDFLKNLFQVYTTSVEIDKVLSFNWKTIYTTNYDDAIECCFKKNGNAVYSYDMDMPATKIKPNATPCVHINGYIRTLTPDKLDNSFKLGNISYDDPVGFLSSSWLTFFKRDIERCGVLIFIGYSLYDLDIRRLLRTSSDIKERTFFICLDNISDEDKYILSSYGKVLPIGLKGFADNLPEPSSITYSPPRLSAFALYTPQLISSPITDDDIDSLFFYGKEKQNFIEDVVNSNDDSKYVVLRHQILQEAQQIVNDNNLVILGDLGNGKTIFLSELAAKIYKDYDVYLLKDPYGDIHTDLNLLSKQNKLSILFIDDYTSIPNLFDTYSLLDTTNLRFIIASRPSSHLRLTPRLLEIGFKYSNLYVDIFNKTETNSLITLADSIGLWGKIPDFTDHTYFFTNKCNSQISGFLLALLDSPNIKRKVNDLIMKLMEDIGDGVMKVIFALGFLTMLEIRVDATLLSELCGDIIYDAKLNSHLAFKELFHIYHGRVISKSSIFSRYLIKNNYLPDYIIQYMLDLADKYNKKVVKTEDDKKILKSTLKFSIIERLLPDANKKVNLKKYYESLKRRIVWLIEDPHFWTQYAMAQIACNDFDKAQQYLTTAYNKARKKPNYHTFPIDTQQARLYLLQALKADNILESVEYFNKSHAKLKLVPDDIYKYRQFYLYIDYFKKFFHNLTIDYKKQYLKSCRELLYPLYHTNLFINSQIQGSIYKLMDIVAQQEKVINSTQ